MNTKKVFLINTEKSERTTIHRKSKRVVFKGFCKTCGTQVEWAASEEVLKMPEDDKEIQNEIGKDKIICHISEDD